MLWTAPATATVIVELRAERVHSVPIKGEVRESDITRPVSDQAETKIQSSPPSKVAHG